MKCKGKYERRRYPRARRENATSLFAHVLISLTHHLTRTLPYFARAYHAEKEQTLGVVTGTLLGKVRHLCPRMYAGIILIAELHPRAKRARGQSPIAKEMW